MRSCLDLLHGYRYVEYDSLFSKSQSRTRALTHPRSGRNMSITWGRPDPSSAEVRALWRESSTAWDVGWALQRAGEESGRGSMITTRYKLQVFFKKV